MNNPVKLEVLPEIFCQTPNQCYIFEKSITIMDELQKSLFRHLSVSSPSPSQSVRPSSLSVILSDLRSRIAVAAMVADMEVHTVADMEVEKVANMVADEKKNGNAKKKKGYPIW